MVTLHTATIDGKMIAYCSETEFIVQVGKGRGKYKNVATFKGERGLGQAILTYKGLNVHSGHKKRLFVPSFNKPVLARLFSQ